MLSESLPLGSFGEHVRHLWDVARAAMGAERDGASRHAGARERDDVEFLPAALEILETPASPAGRALLWALIALFSIALVWSVVGKLDVVAVAQGRLVPTGQSKVVQPLEAGIVKAILVVNGEHVTQGQPLIELDAAQTTADVGKTKTARVDALLAKARARALLDAQQNGGMPRLDSASDAGPAREREAQVLAESLINEYRSKLGELRTEAQKRETELETARQKINGLEQTAPIARSLADDYKTLVAQNFMSKHAWLEKEQASIQLEQDLATQRSVARELQAGLSQQRQNIETAQAQFRHEQLDALNQAQQQLAQAEAEEAKATQRHSQTHLTAPVAGTVQQLAVHTVGGVVTPAQELLVVVPDNAGLELEAQVLNRDIGFVRKGQPVEIKLDAFPYTHYGTVQGEVEAIGQDAAKDDKLGLVYPARIRLSEAMVKAEGHRMSLTPGMTADAEIKTEQRRIIEYLLTPLLRYRSEAARER
jgi:hemolysin D